MEWNNEEERKSEKNGWWAKVEEKEVVKFERLMVSSVVVLFELANSPVWHILYLHQRLKIETFIFDEECFCSSRYVSKIVGSMLDGKGLWERWGWKFSFERKRGKVGKSVGRLNREEIWNDARNKRSVTTVWEFCDDNGHVIKYKTKGGKGWVKKFLFCKTHYAFCIFVPV